MRAKKKPVRAVTVTPVNEPRLLTVKSAAAYLSASVWSIRCLAWNRVVPHLKIGSRILFDRGDLDSYIESQKTEVA
jgi:excisionase family DNA binding protein